MEEQEEKVHVLNEPWKMYYTMPFVKTVKITDWSDLVKQVAEFSTVEEFWGLFNNVPNAQEIEVGADYNLFRSTIFPSWENEHNIKGGKWHIEFRQPEPHKMQTLWTNCCLYAIGETGEFHDRVSGVVFSQREGKCRLAIWIRECNEDTDRNKIGEHWKKSIGLNDSDRISYSPHAAADTRKKKH